MVSSWRVEQTYQVIRLAIKFVVFFRRPVRFCYYWIFLFIDSEFLVGTFNRINADASTEIDQMNHDISNLFA